jgi:hypothetical protein
MNQNQLWENIIQTLHKLSYSLWNNLLKLSLYILPIISSTASTSILRLGHYTKSQETIYFCEQFSYTQYIFVNNLSTFSTFSWGAWVASGLFRLLVACAAAVHVYTLRPKLHLDVSNLQGPVPTYCRTCLLCFENNLLTVRRVCFALKIILFLPNVFASLRKIICLLTEVFALLQK